MPARYGEEIRGKIISLWIMAYSEQAIAGKVEVHVNTVRNYVAELKAGHYPKYDSFLPYLEDIRRLSQRLRSNSLALEEAVTGIAIIQGLNQLGIQPAELQAAIDFFQRVAPLNLPTQQFVKIALNITKMETQNGMSLSDLNSLANRLASEIPHLRNEKANLTQNISRLQTVEQEALVKNQTTQTKLNQYIEDRETLNRTGLGINDKRSGTEAVLQAAREMAQLVATTGKSLTELVADYKQTLDLERQSRVDQRNVQSETERTRTELQRLQQEIPDQLARNQLTSSDLANFLSTREKLAARGIEMGKLEPLEKTLAEIEKQGFSAPAVVARLDKIDGLEQQKARLERLVADTQVQLNSATKELQNVSEKVTAERAQLTKLQEDTAQTRATLTRLQQEAKDVSESIQLAKTFTQLLYEPGTIIDHQIFKMNDLLQQVLKARADVRRLPIDYNGLKEAFRELLETLHGDKLLPRDKLDREMGMIRRGWAELHSREKELAIDASVLDNATWAELLLTAIGEIRKGRLFLGSCKECKSIAAVRLGSGSAYYSYYKCPVCMRALKPRDLPQMKQVSA
jgi:DNA repair exonuclease SbcCD ATPase subunit